MFLPIDYQSVNTRADIRAGRLRAFSAVYSNAGVGLMAQLLEYFDDDTGEAVFMELVTSEADGSIRVHDYVLLHSGYWRSAFGEVASSPAALLPVELTAANLVSRSDLGVIALEAVHV